MQALLEALRANDNPEALGGRCTLDDGKNITMWVFPGRVVASRSDLSWCPSSNPPIVWDAAIA